MRTVGEVAVWVHMDIANGFVIAMGWVACALSFCYSNFDVVYEAYYMLKALSLSMTFFLHSFSTLPLRTGVGGRRLFFPFYLFSTNY